MSKGNDDKRSASSLETDYLQRSKLLNIFDIKHPNIGCLENHHISQTEIITIEKFYSCITLKDFIQGSKEGRIDEVNTRKIIKKVCKAVSYIHILKGKL